MSKPNSERITRLAVTALDAQSTETPGIWQRAIRGRKTHLGILACALASAIATATDSGIAARWERQVQTLFFELRGPVAAPTNIVILAIDEQSLAQGQAYRSNPEQYAELEPLQTWPWPRATYAQAIDRLMEAGAKAVVLNLLFDAPSSYGSDDDAQLKETFRQYGDRIALAASYENARIRQGNLIQLIQPHAPYRAYAPISGTINFLLEGDRRIHQLGRAFPRHLAKAYPDQAELYQQWAITTPSLAEAALQAAQVSYPKPRGSHLFFYGPGGSFEHIPFWHILNADNWNTYLQAGQYFRDKIVLIGPTASLLQNFQNAPFSGTAFYPEQLSGVELHANAIATLMQNRTLKQAVPQTTGGGLLVFILLASIGWGLSRPQGLVSCLSWTLGIIVAWTITSYLLFVAALTIVPTATPAIAIALCGTLYSVERWRRNATAPPEASIAPLELPPDTASKPVDAPRDLCGNRVPPPLGKLIQDRYCILEVLGTGGFGETYIAEDRGRPGKPECVVKQLKITSDDPKVMQVARRLFHREAQTLEQLGHHDQIPQLYAYLEEDREFYLVQELIQGTPLSSELTIGQPLSEMRVLRILQDLLSVLEFVHQQGVIHRDIKPSNIIRRQSDRKLVLIDFGAVKLINSQSTGNLAQNSITIGIGTRGYAPREQCLGKPLINSDLYAVGAIAIQALTGLPVNSLQDDPKTGELIWQHQSKTSNELAVIINQMVRVDCRQRYQTAHEVLQDLQPLLDALPTDAIAAELPTRAFDDSDSSNPTRPWTLSVVSQDPLVTAPEVPFPSNNE